MQSSTQNRNGVYFSQIEKLKGRRKTVFKLIKTYGFISAHQIAKKMRLSLNCVSGRLTELKDMFLIVEAAKIHNDKTKVLNTLWRVVRQDERTDLVNAKYQELINTRDGLINDFNLNISDITKEVLEKELKKINKKIEMLNESL